MWKPTDHNPERGEDPREGYNYEDVGVWSRHDETGLGWEWDIEGFVEEFRQAHLNDTNTEELE